MANEKLFTAKQAAQAVLAKARELLKKSDLLKAEPIGEIHPKEQNATPPNGVQKSPNPENQEVNGNPGPGANPQNYGSEFKGHLKLAKFIGHMEAKRKMRTPQNG